jgi:hypothetical protein
MLDALIDKLGTVWTFDQTCPACQRRVRAEIEWGLVVTAVKVRQES